MTLYINHSYPLTVRTLPLHNSYPIIGCRDYKHRQGLMKSAGSLIGLKYRTCNLIPAAICNDYMWSKHSFKILVYDKNQCTSAYTFACLSLISNKTRRKCSKKDEFGVKFKYNKVLYRVGH